MSRELERFKKGLRKKGPITGLFIMYSGTNGKFGNINYVGEFTKYNQQYQPFTRAVLSMK